MSRRKTKKLPSSQILKLSKEKTEKGIVRRIHSTKGKTMLKLVTTETQKEVKVAEIQYLSDTEIQRINYLKKVAKANYKRSDVYQASDTQEMVGVVGNYLTAKGFEFETSLILGAGSKSSKHIVEFKITHQHGEEFTIAGGEGNPKILLTNSFNGESPLSIYGGIFRFVCANGIVSGKFEKFVRIIHKIGITYEEKVRNMEYQIAATLTYLTDQFGEKIIDMKSTELSYEDKMRIILSLKQLNSNVTAHLAGVLHPDNKENLREADQPDTLWATFNLVNEALRTEGRTKTLEDGTIQGVDEFNKNETLIDDICEIAKAA